MHVSYASALIVTALVASASLVMERGNRIFPVIALIASGVEALIVFGVITFSMRSARVDVILPALLAVAGVVCWARTTSKGAVTAATLVALVGLLQLFLAVRVLR